LRRQTLCLAFNGRRTLDGQQRILLAEQLFESRTKRWPLALRNVEVGSEVQQGALGNPAVATFGADEAMGIVGFTVGGLAGFGAANEHGGKRYDGRRQSAIPSDKYYGTTKRFLGLNYQKSMTYSSFELVCHDFHHHHVKHGLAALRSAIPCWLEDAENGLTVLFRSLLNGLWEDLRHLDERIVTMDAEVDRIAKSDPVAQRLQQLRGVGPLIATALIASVGDGEQFSQGRQMAAALGLTPRQHSSGGKARLLGISKRGDPYLRSILIHGARSTVAHAKHKEDRLSQWMTGLAERRHLNVAAVALANKTVRMAWAMMRNESDYDPNYVAA
jgi:hypothetical protein